MRQQQQTSATCDHLVPCPSRCRQHLLAASRSSHKLLQHLLQPITRRACQPTCRARAERDQGAATRAAAAAVGCQRYLQTYGRAASRCTTCRSAAAGDRHGQPVGRLRLAALEMPLLRGLCSRASCVLLGVVDAYLLTGCVFANPIGEGLQVAPQHAGTFACSCLTRKAVCHVCHGRNTSHVCACTSQAAMCVLLAHAVQPHRWCARSWHTCMDVCVCMGVAWIWEGRQACAGRSGRVCCVETSSFGGAFQRGVLET